MGRAASPRYRFLPAASCLALLAGLVAGPHGPARPPSGAPADDYAAHVRPALATYCLACHSTEKKKGDLDLERFASAEHLWKEPEPWQSVLEMLENGEMPPKKSPQPAPEERRRLAARVRGLLDAAARDRAGDPGRVVVRRLSNTEYDNTVRDLTGVDLRPARDFPVDGSAGEGFTNVGDALVVSPALLDKYLAAAKEVAAHAVLLPDGFRFSPATTRRDWTDEVLAELDRFYGRFTPDGKLPLARYLAATLLHRDRLTSGAVSPEALAAAEGLSPKYLRTLWDVLNDRRPSFLLDRIRDHWRRAAPADAAALAAEVGTWQAPLWKYNVIGSYRDGKTVRQEPVVPAFVPSHTLRYRPKPGPGQTEVTLYLAVRKLAGKQGGCYAVWHRPRFEGAKEPPVLLRDLGRLADRYAVDFGALYADCDKYLAAALDAANDRTLALDALAGRHGLDTELLRRWCEFLAVEPLPAGPADPEAFRPRGPAIPLHALGKKLVVRGPAVWAWGTDEPDTLPALFANSSDRTEAIPGTVGPHKVAVHPAPARFVAAAWNCPIDGTVRLRAAVNHAHPVCGNGVVWWLEHRRDGRAAALDGGFVRVNMGAEARPRRIKVRPGDQIVLAVGARDLDHSCDLTAIEFAVAETDGPRRTWDLARDVADNVTQGNPHADRYGNRDIWLFARGDDPTARGIPIFPGRLPGLAIPPNSWLDAWREAASDPARRQELGALAVTVRNLLAGPRPVRDSPNRVLYDKLVSYDSPLLEGIDLSRHRGAPAETSGSGARSGARFARFGRHPSGAPIDEASLVVPANAVIEVRVPAVLFRDRAFVADGHPDPIGAGGVLQFAALATPPPPNAPLDPATPCVSPHGCAAEAEFRAGLDEFRRAFPPFVCYRRVIPDDEEICLKLYHREDEPLARLFLDEDQRRQLDRTWLELRHVSRWPEMESRNLPTFIGFVTQDGNAKKTAFYEGLREPFRKRAEDFEHELEGAASKQLEALADFASRAYRRPLEDAEKSQFAELYAGLRNRGLGHDEAMRATLARVLVSPSFLFRIERPAPESEAGPVTDWELATRLSYFLWASAPDAELRRAAAENRLHDPRALAEQTQRMLGDPKVRGLATEFGTQWAHVRDIRHNREKNEKLFPTFDDNLRQALSEEAVRFFEHLFQADRPLREVVDADWTFLNETLARHYAIPGVAGPEWRLVEGVKQYGRGGVLALGAVQAAQSGASRTSPVLRGNWLLEVLLGEKLPKPPANVPQLPDDGSAGAALTVRQMVERHARIAECAVCHRRIDPFGFALEQFDPIGRFRNKDAAGRPIDARARLGDGTEFDGLDGLRDYLLTRRGGDFERHFCTKLLGYALGRSVTLTDRALIDEMLDALHKNDGRLTGAVQTIVQSKQFRYHRGRGADE
jgi:hypothetical protein